MAELPATLVKENNAKSVVWVYFGLTADEKGVPVPSEEHRPVSRTCKKAVMCIAFAVNNVILLNYRDNIEYRDKMWDVNRSSENSLSPIPRPLGAVFVWNDSA